MKEKKNPNKFMREHGERIGQNCYQTSTRQHTRIDQEEDTVKGVRDQ
ncbi:hypothetical protein E2C01_060922 [Portunus trituberculatus]|uniref:Uncharacterized protein n=1 Tax=Portunus trituberculatus TaxID=210409 RepID=A0A5B7HAD5_PORTR|nr:hypothetical protein [Portunus trituberculatus]